VVKKEFESIFQPLIRIVVKHQKRSVSVLKIKICFQEWKPLENTTFIYIAFLYRPKMYCHAKQY